MKLVKLMKKWPSNLQKLITYFGRLPGIGPKMAERIVLSLLNKPKNELKDFADTLASITQGLKSCSSCFTLSDTELCDTCSDKTRDGTATLLIVADPVSALNIEQSGEYKGHYFILGGLINPLEGMTPEKLNIKPLLTKLKAEPHIKEIIFAFNPNTEGEATLIYLKKLLEKNRKFLYTRLARGIGVGADLAYADEATLASAVHERQQIN